MSVLFGLGLSVLYSIYILSPKEGSIPRIPMTVAPVLYKGRIIIPFGERAIHIHHWIIYLLLLLIIQTKLVWYFCLGMFIQGLTYKDRFDVIERNPYLQIKKNSII